MLYCKPKYEYFTDDQGKQRFLRMLLKIWDHRDYFDPGAIRRQEEYEDIDEALARLDEFSDEPSFDPISRNRMSLLANRLRQYKRGGVLRSPKRTPNVDLSAIISKAMEGEFGRR